MPPRSASACSCRSFFRSSSSAYLLNCSMQRSSISKIGNCWHTYAKALTAYRRQLNFISAWLFRPGLRTLDCFHSCAMGLSGEPGREQLHPPMRDRHVPWSLTVYTRISAHETPVWTIYRSCGLAGDPGQVEHILIHVTDISPKLKPLDRDAEVDLALIPRVMTSSLVWFFKLRIAPWDTRNA